MARYSYSRSYYREWAPYVPVAERRRQAARALQKRLKTGRAAAPVTIAGRQIATTFWGKAWCDNMESYHDFANRLPRGRTYVRNGSVIDLQIAPGKVTALVSGSQLYEVAIDIGALPKKAWAAIRADCAGGIDSLVELLQGRLSTGVMERLCRQNAGLFPRPAEIRFSCSCPDYASMCKHVAASLYGIGARLDHEPELLFRLRVVDAQDLIAGIDLALPAARQPAADGKVLADGDLSALFGIEMAPPPAEDAAVKPKRPRATRAAPARKRAAKAGKAASIKTSGARRPKTGAGNSGTAVATKRRRRAKPKPTRSKV